jgi:hypothetical protein
MRKIMETLRRDCILADIATDHLALLANLFNAACVAGQETVPRRH